MPGMPTFPSTSTATPAGEASARGCTAVLCRCCALRGFHNLYGIVTGENSASIRFHERMGFARLGTLPRTGYKLGRWHDVIWFGLRLCPADAPGAPPALRGCMEADRETMARFSR